MDKLWRLEYRAGWDLSLPLLSWYFVIADDPVIAVKKLQDAKSIHPDNVIKIEPQPFIP